MKQEYKDIIAQAVYSLYKKGILKNKLKVMSIDETIDELIQKEKSLIRFGDGEITVIRGRGLKLQIYTEELAKDLKRILGYQHEKLLIAIPDIFEGVEYFPQASRQFWKDHLLFGRKVYQKYCDTEKHYGNSFISRCYYLYQNPEQSGKYFSKMKDIWKDKDIVLVEGEKSHSGVGNDLFSTALSVRRILGPAQDAYSRIDLILEECRKYPDNTLFLLALGAAAKPLGEKLFLEGYRVIDIGNLDLEYEWYLRGASGKIEIEKYNIVGEEANRKAGYTEYLEQIVARIK